jgi:hypothetical protein
VDEMQGGQAVYDQLNTARRELTAQLEDAGVLQSRRST